MKTIIILLILIPAIALCWFSNIQAINNREIEKKPFEIVEDTVKIYMDSAKYFQELGNYMDAIKYYQLAAFLKPDYNDAYIGWLTTCFGHDMEEEGIKAINQWITLNPENTTAWLYKAFAEAERNPEESLNAFNKLIELQPDEATNWIGKGQMLYALKRYSEALEAFNKYTSIDTTRTDVWGMKASTLSQLGRYEEAISIINEALRNNPGDPSSIYNRACIYSIQGNKANALADLKRAIEIEGSFREYARTDEDFKSLYDDENFKNLTK
jgi:tetratricopeptide (TPR) repeat protein